MATVLQSQPVTSMPLSDEELTFKAGAPRRPGAAVATTDDAVKSPVPQKTVRGAKPRRAVTQIYEMPDGRRVTVHRGYRDDDDRRLRAAEAGRRYGESSGGFFGERRSSWGFGGLY